MLVDAAEGLQAIAVPLDRSGADGTSRAVRGNATFHRRNAARRPAWRTANRTRLETSTDK
jgi:hypothetical protein